MEPEAKYTLVGTAVLVLLGLIAAAVIWLRDTGEAGQARSFKIYFERHSLEGLQIRSDVKMLGIRVGSVSGFRISARRPGAVEVLIRVDENTPVRTSTRAVVERHLVTGLASIRLVNLDEESPPLVQTPAGEPYPLIAEGESPMQQVSESVTQLAQRAGETLQRISGTLSDDNQKALAEILQNLRTLTADADRTVITLNQTIASVGRTAEEIRALSTGLAGDARKLAARYDSLGAESSAAVGEIGAAVRRMSADVERLSQRAETLLASSDEEVRATAQALRSAADSLGATARRLSDPGSALFGPPPGALGPGEAPR
jgi:phospholipid/cholesterol/gamma-HCH transport system substrate-binding protein